MDAPLPLAFGCELEFILAFKQQLLEQVLRRNNKASEFPVIIKDLGEREEGLRNKWYPTHPYRSWALSEDGKLRGYVDEPLEIAHQILAPGGQAFNVLPMNETFKSTDYSRWQITNDLSLEALAPAELGEGWDSYGIELVCPPYTALAAAKDNLSQICGTIESGEHHRATVTKGCGLHIHVGRPDGIKFPVRTIQMLAYLVVVYEDEIHRLHEPHRRNNPRDIKSVRQQFLADCAEPEERTVRDERSGELVTKMFEPIYEPLHNLKQLLYLDKPEAEVPIAKLADKLGKTKSFLVNFRNTNREDAPATVEFRQYAGTLDPTSICWWIEFCLGLVRYAHSLASTGESLPVNHWDDRIDMDDLWERMGFSEEGRSFYRQRREEYAGMEDWEPYPLWAEWGEYPEDELVVETFDD